MSDISMSSEHNDYFGLNYCPNVPKLVEYEDEDENLEIGVEESNFREMADDRNKIRILQDLQIPQNDSHPLELQEKLIRRTEIVADKRSAALNSISDVMKGANKMLTRISEISKSNIEIEKLRHNYRQTLKNPSVRVNNKLQLIEIKRIIIPTQKIKIF